MKEDSGVMSSDSFSLFSNFFGAVDMIQHEKNQFAKKKKKKVGQFFLIIRWSSIRFPSAVARAFQ